MQTTLKDIRERIQREDFQGAVTLCEAALKSPDGKTFTMYSTLGTCALQAGDKKTALSAFEGATSCPDASAGSNALQCQKVWKALADLYEEFAMWDKQALALSKLYDIVFEKGNVERCQALGELLLDAFNNAKNYTDGMQFASSHAQKLNAFDVPKAAIARVIDRFTQFHELEMNKKTAKLASIGLSTKDPQQQPATKKPVFPDPIIAILRTVLPQLSEIHSPTVALYLKRFLDSCRSAVYAASSAEMDFSVLASLAAEFILQCPSSLQLEPDISAYWAEACYFSSPCGFVPTDTSPVPQPAVLAAVESATNSNNLGSLLLHIRALLETGRITTVKPLLAKALQLVLLHRENGDQALSRTASPPSEATSTISTGGASAPAVVSVLILLLQAFVLVGLSFHGFQGLSHEDMLHLLHISASRLTSFTSLRLLPLQPLASSSSPELPAVVSQLRMAKVLALCKVGHLQVARSELWLLVQSPGLRWYDEGSPVDQWNLAAVAAQPMLSQWLLLSCTRTAELFSHAAAIASGLLDKLNTSSGTGSKCWLIAESAFAEVQADIYERFATSQRNVNGSGGRETVPGIAQTLIRDTLVNEQRAAGAVRSLQAILKGTGAGTDTADLYLVPEIEALVRFRMGVVMWHAGGRLRSDKAIGCLAQLMASAKLDPTGGSSGAVYTYLGHCHDDIVVKTRCYTKALLSDPLDREAGIALSVIYSNMNNNDNNGSGELERLLDNVTASTHHAHWSYTVKGQLHLRRQEYQPAVEHFQLALELRADDVVSWYGLGVAYAAQEQNVAALKAFSKVLEVYPRDLAVVVAAADVERKLCLLAEAKERYRFALREIDGKSLVALKGLATVCVALCYGHGTVGWTAGVARELMEGISAVDTAIADPAVAVAVAVAGPDDNADSEAAVSKLKQCLYKLKGDLCMQAMYAGPADLVVCSAQQQAAPSSSFSSVTDLYAEKLRYLALAEQCYETVATLAASEAQHDQEQVDLAEVLFDVGLACYQRASTVMESMGQGSGLVATDQLYGDPVAASLLDKARDRFTAGLEANPLHSGCWNGLGLCLIGPEQIVQRRCCFVRATQTAGVSGTGGGNGAYANLGLDLVRCKEEAMGLECFSALQLVESNPLVWASLGCIFESSNNHNNNTSKNKSKAFDSYTAACEVAKPAEALLGSVVSWLKLAGVLSANKNCVAAVGYWGDPSRWQCVLRNDGDSDSKSGMGISVGLAALHHKVTLPLRAYLQQRPAHPLAWQLLAWASEVTGAVGEALQQRLQALRCLNHIVAVNTRDSSSSAKDLAFIPRARHIARELLAGCRRCIAKLAVMGHSGKIQADMLTHLPISHIQAIMASTADSDISLLQLTPEAALQALLDGSVPFELPYNQHLRHAMWRTVYARSDSSALAISIKGMLSLLLLLPSIESNVDADVAQHFDSLRRLQFEELIRLTNGVLGGQKQAQSTSPSSSGDRLWLSSSGLQELLVAANNTLEREQQQQEQTGNGKGQEGVLRLLRWLRASPQLCAWIVKLASSGGFVDCLSHLLDVAATSWHSQCAYLLLMYASHEPNAHSNASAHTGTRKIELCDQALSLCSQLRAISQDDSDQPTESVSGSNRHREVEAQNSDLPESSLYVCSKAALLRYMLAADAVITGNIAGDSEDAIAASSSAANENLLRALHTNPADVNLYRFIFHI